MLTDLVEMFFSCSEMVLYTGLEYSVTKNSTVDPDWGILLGFLFP